MTFLIRKKNYFMNPIKSVTKREMLMYYFRLREYSFLIEVLKYCLYIYFFELKNKRVYVCLFLLNFNYKNLYFFPFFILLSIFIIIKIFITKNSKLEKQTLFFTYQPTKSIIASSLS